jgi:hypothetical protein
VEFLLRFCNQYLVYISHFFTSYLPLAFWLIEIDLSRDEASSSRLIIRAIWIYFQDSHVGFLLDRLAGAVDAVPFALCFIPLFKITKINIIR